MSSIDERVVEMRFDNAQFEHGVKQTLSSLDKLKAGLKFDNALNGMNVLQNAFNGLKLGNIGRSVDQINNKFSALGIAGMEVVKRVTNAALDSVNRIATAIPKQIKQGGWSRALNLENAQFQLKGLGVTWDKVNNDIQYAVNGTAYGLDAAAKVAGQLAASGIQVSDSALTATKSVDDFADSCMGMKSAELKSTNQLDEMSTALRSISGVAAMTNTSYEEIGQIFTRVAGQGRVFATDLNSISARGINAAATLAKYLGTTETEVRDMVSKGQIDFKTFSDAMYDTYADQARKANETFQGALSNTKSALSRIGADVADDLIPALTKILNSCRLLFNQVHKWIQPVLDSTGRLIAMVGDTLSPIIDAIRAKVEKITGITGGPIEQIAGVIDKITEKLQGVRNKVLSALGIETQEEAEKASESVEKVATSLEHINDMAKQVIRGDFGNGQKRVDALHAIGENYELIQNKVNELLGCSYRYEVQEDATADAINNTADATETAAKKTEELKEKRDSLVKVKGHMLNGLLNIGKTIAFVFETIADAVKETASTLASDFGKIDKLPFAEGFDEFTGTIINSQKNMETFKQVVDDVVSGIGNLLEALGQVAGAFGKAFIETLQEINGQDPTKASGAFKDLTENLKLSKDGAEGLKDVFKLILSPLKVIVPLMQRLGTFLLKVVSAAAKVNSKFLEFVGKSKIIKSLGKIFSQLKESISRFNSELKKSKGFQKFVQSAKDLKNAIGDKLSKAFDDLADKLSKFNGIEGDTSWIEKFADAVGDGFGKISDVINGITDFINGKVNPFEAIGNWFKQLAKDISESNIGEAIKKLDFTKALSNLKDNAKKGIEKIDLKDIDFGKIFGNIKKSVSEKVTGIDFSDAFKPLKSNLSSSISTSIGGALSGGMAGVSGETSTQKTGIFSEIGNNIKDAFTSIDWQGIGDAVKNGIGKFLKALSDIFENADFQKIYHGVVDFLKIILAFKFVKKAMETMTSLGGMNDSIKGFFDTLTTTVNDLKKFAKTKLRVKVFREIAISVAILAGAVAGLSILSNFTNVGVGLAIVSLLIAELSGIFIAIGKMKLDPAKINAFGKAAFMFSSGLGILTFALSKVSKMDNYLVALGRLALLIGLVAGVFIAMGRLVKYKINAAPFITFAIAIKLLTGSLGILALIPFNLYEKGLERLAILMLALTAAISVINLTAKNAGNVHAGALLAFALDVVAMTVALMLLALIPMEKIITAAASLSGIMIALGFSMMLASKNTEAAKTAKAFAIEAAAVGISLAVLANQNMDGVFNAAVSMALVIGALGAAMKLAANNSEATKTALGFAVEAAAVGFALCLLAGYSFDQLLPAAIAMAGVIFALSGAIRLAAENANAVGQALAFAVEAAVVGLSLAVLATLPIPNIVAAAAAIAGVVLALAGAGVIANAGVLGLLALSAAVIAVGAAIGVAAVGIGVGMTLASVAAQLFAQAFSVVVETLVSAITTLTPLSDELPSLANGILKLAGAGAVAGLAMIPLSAGIVAVGVALVPFAVGLAVVSAAINVAVAAFGNLANAIGSVIKYIPGLGDVGKGLQSAADDIKNFSAKADKPTENPIQGIIDSVKEGNKELADELNNTKDITSKGTSNAASTSQNGSGGAAASNANKTADAVKQARATVKSESAGMVSDTQGIGTAISDNLAPTEASGKLDELISKFTAKTQQGGEASGTAFNTGMFDQLINGDISNIDISSMFGGNLSPEAFSAAATGDGQAFNQDFINSMMNGDISNIDISSMFGGNLSPESFGLAATGDGQAFNQDFINSMMNGDMSNVDISSMFGGNLSPEAFAAAATGDGQAFNQDFINSMMNGDMSNVDISSMFGGNLSPEAFAAAATGDGQAFNQDFINSMMNGDISQIDPTSLMSKFGLSQDAAQSNGKNLATSTFGAWADAMDSADPSGPVSEMFGKVDTTSQGRKLAQGAVKGVNSQKPLFGMAGTKSAKAYADNIGKVDTTSRGRKLGQGAVKGVNSQKPLFGMAGTSSEELYITNLSKGDATAGGRQLAASALRGVRAKGGEFGTVGSSNGSSYASAIAGSDQSAAARDAGNSLSKSAQSGLENGSSYAASSGRHLSENYAAGIRAGSGSAIAAARELANEISAILKHSTPKEGPLKDDNVWGLHLGQNIANGIGKSAPVVKKSAYRIASTINGVLGHSTPKEGPLKDDDKWGTHLGQNFATGIDEASDEVKNSARSMADGVWSEVQKSNANGKKSVDDLAKDLVDKANDTLKKERKIRKISSSEVTEYWKQLLSKVKSNGKNLLDENGNINDAIYKSAKDLVDNHKEQVDSYLTDESRFWKEVIRLTEEGTEGRENAIKEYNAALLSDPENYIKKQTLKVGEKNVRQAEVWKAQMEAVAKDGDNVWDTTKQKLSEDFNKAIITDAGNQVRSYKDRIGEAADATRKFYKDAILYAKKNGATIATQEELMKSYGEAAKADADAQANNYVKKMGWMATNTRQFYISMREEAIKFGATIATQEELMKSYGEAAEADADAQANNYVKKMGWMATNTRQFYISMREEAIKFGASQSAVSKLTEKAGNAMVNDLKTTVSMMQEQGKSAREIDKTLSLMMTSIDPAIMTEEMWDSANSVWHENHEKAQEQILSDAENDLDKLGTYYDLSNTQQAVYWKGILKTMDKNSDAYSKAEDKFLAARNAAWKEYADSVKSSLDKLNSDLSIGSEFKFNEQGFDILGNRQNELAAAEEYGRQVSEAIGRGILSDDVVSQLKESFGVKDTWAWQMINGYSDAQLEQLNNVTQEIIDRNKETAETLNKSIKPDFLYTDAEVKSISDSVQNVMQTMTDITKDPKWSESVAESMKTIAGYAAKTTKEEKTQDYVTLGNNLIDGAIRGITMRSPALAAACAAAVSRAIAAAQAEAQVHSPSKKTTKIGSFMGEGFVLGMKDWLGSAGAMGKNLGDSALSGMNYMLAALASDINDDMDMSPTIRPVIDMSDVNASASAINSMLSADQAMRVAAGFDTMMASRQNGSGNVTNDNSVGSINVNIYPTSSQNANDISDAVIKKLNNEIIRKRKVYA